MTLKFLLITAFSIMGIILTSGCINEEKTKVKLGDEILNIGENIPEGWNYTIITKDLEDIERPQGLWEPVAIVNFANPDKEIGYYPDSKNNKKYYPSLQLYFYNITEKQEIMEIIDKEFMHSSCIPIYFGETGKYIIVTSPCYINSGIFTEEARNYYSPLEKSLKDYFEKYKESKERGLTIIEKVELSEDEKARQSNLIGNILDEIRQESAKERYTAEGAYIAPSEKANMMKYIKKLLALI